MYFQFDWTFVPAGDTTRRLLKFFIRSLEISNGSALASDLEQFKEFSSMLDVKSKLNHGTSWERSNAGKVLRTINYFGNSVPAYRTATRQ